MLGQHDLLKDATPHPPMPPNCERVAMLTTRYPQSFERLVCVQGWEEIKK